eukprot:5058756-Heterocapsa_arctica.AAC.1
MLRALVKPQFGESSFVEDWMLWEKAVLDYEEASGQRVDDSMKVAALIDGAPPSVRQFLRLVPCQITCYDDLRLAVKNFVARGSTFDAQGNERVVPMDIGALLKEKEKDKQQS